jgi:hypothetical protein
MNGGWNIYGLSVSQTNSGYIWKTVDGQAYALLSWQSVS